MTLSWIPLFTLVCFFQLWFETHSGYLYIDTHSNNHNTHFKALFSGLTFIGHVARGSWLVARGLWLWARGSGLVARGSGLAARGLVARGSRLVARGSWLVARGSWLGARGSGARGSGYIGLLSLAAQGDLTHTYLFSMKKRENIL